MFNSQNITWLGGKYLTFVYAGIAADFMDNNTVVYESFGIHDYTAKNVYLREENNSIVMECTSRNIE